MLSDEFSPAFDAPDDWWQCDGSSCSRIELIEDPCRSNTIYIRNLETDLAHRGQGYAKRLLRKVCGVAGKCAVDLSLHVEDTRKFDCQILVDWYRREGFEGEMYEMIWHHNQSE